MQDEPAFFLSSVSGFQHNWKMDQGQVELLHIAHCLVGTELNQLTPLIDIIRLPVSCFIPPIS